MVEHAFVRITLPYDMLQSLLATWAQYCEKMAVVQHEGEKTQKLHVHILMYNMSRTWKQFQNIACRDFYSVWSQLKGNEMISKKKAYKYDAMATIRYMLKGQLDLSYNKGYDAELLSEAKASWKVDPEKKSKLQDQLERFVTYVYDMGYVYGDLDYFTCKRCACKFAYDEYNKTFPMPMAMNLVKSIVYSSKFDIGFQIPEGDRWEI